MKRIIFSVDAIQIVMLMRAGLNETELQKAYKIDQKHLLALAEYYRSVPYQLLVRMRRSLLDNDRLRHFIAKVATQGYSRKV